MRQPRSDATAFEDLGRAFEPFLDPVGRTRLRLISCPSPRGTTKPARLGSGELPQPGTHTLLGVARCQRRLALGGAMLPYRPAGPPLGDPEALLQHRDGAAAAFGTYPFAAAQPRLDAT